MHTTLGALQANLEKRDSNSRVAARLRVLGFPVFNDDPMLNSTGSGLAKSMVPFTLMLAALGGLEEGADDVVIDVHPLSSRWDGCHKGLLDKTLIAEVARCAL